MAIGFHVGNLSYEVGAGSFLNCFFSTLVHRIENDERGSKYPLLTKTLYQGSLSWEKAQEAAKELEDAKAELKNYSPENVVWDIDDLSKGPPWGNNISKDITDLSNYFVTSDGKDLIAVLFKVFASSVEMQVDIKIQ
jgi:2,3-bisphosphoglycerate-dependent phosphoglycerate mutase